MPAGIGIDGEGNLVLESTDDSTQVVAKKDFTVKNSGPVSFEMEVDGAPARFKIEFDGIEANIEVEGGPLEIQSNDGVKVFAKLAELEARIAALE